MGFYELVIFALRLGKPQIIVSIRCVVGGPVSEAQEAIQFGINEPFLYPFFPQLDRPVGVAIHDVEAHKAFSGEEVIGSDGK